MLGNQNLTRGKVRTETPTSINATEHTGTEEGGGNYDCSEHFLVRKLILDDLHSIHQP